MKQLHTRSKSNREKLLNLYKLKQTNYQSSTLRLELLHSSKFTSIEVLRK